MIVIGVLLLIAAAAFGIDLIWKNDVHIGNPTVFGEKLGIHSAASLFAIGAITGAVVLLGIVLLLWGFRRKGASVAGRRHERREMRRLREERDQQQVPPQDEVRSSPEREEPQTKVDYKAPEATPTAAAGPGDRPTATTETDPAREV